jgi:hypothetical protein
MGAGVLLSLEACMSKHLYSIALGVAVIAAGGPPSVQAETLLMQRVQQERGVPLPTRGTTMARVERDFGTPSSKLDPRGGDAPTHPVINRWVYERFTVYFERDRVIDAVVNRASPTEIGPKGTPSTQ